jgi:hypothetical protein
LLDQRTTALARANAVRIERARIKRALAVGELDVREILEDPPPECLRMGIGELLLAVPKVGDVRLRGFLRQAMVDAGTRQLGRLSARQRSVLADMVDMRCRA